MLPGLGPKKALQNLPKTDPKSSPGGFQRAKNNDKQRCSIRAEIPTHFWTISGPQMGPQMGSKIAEKSDLDPPSRPRDAKGRPEASREHFLGLQETILVPLCGHFGTVWWSCSNNFTAPPSSLYLAASIFRRSRYLLALSLLLPWRPRYSGSAGARVSA